MSEAKNRKSNNIRSAAIYKTVSKTRNRINSTKKRKKLDALNV